MKVINISRFTARKRIRRQWGWKGWYTFLNIFRDRSKYLDFEVRMFHDIMRDTNEPNQIAGNHRALAGLADFLSEPGAPDYQTQRGYNEPKVIARRRPRVRSC